MPLFQAPNNTEISPAKLANPGSPQPATASGTYRRNKFVSLGGISSRNNEDTKSWGGSLVVSWRIMRWLLLDLSYTYHERTTVGSDRSTTGGSATGFNQFDTDNYAENRIQAAFRFNF